jgi:hypothetical protein
MLAVSWYRKMLSLVYRTMRPVSRDTQSECWPSAGTEKCSHLFLGLCGPFCVTRNPDVGRQLVAARRIAAGEILCQEEPLIVGPNQVTTETVYFKTFMDPRNRFLQGTDSPPAYVVAWRAGTKTTLFLLGSWAHRMF